MEHLFYLFEKLSTNLLGLLLVVKLLHYYNYAKEDNLQYQK